VVLISPVKRLAFDENYLAQGRERIRFFKWDSLFEDPSRWLLVLLALPLLILPATKTDTFGPVGSFCFYLVLLQFLTQGGRAFYQASPPPSHVLDGGAVLRFPGLGFPTSGYDDWCRKPLAFCDHLYFPLPSLCGLSL